MEPLAIYAGCAVVAFVLGVLFSQKVKDTFAGVDTDLRSRLKSFEKDALAKTNAEWTKLVDKVVPLPAIPVAAAPVAAAPTPAPTPVASAPVAAAPTPAPVPPVAQAA